MARRIMDLLRMTDALFCKEEAFLDPAAWLTCSSMAKLTADLNMISEQEHTLVL